MPKIAIHSKTPDADNLKSKGIEWVPLGRYEEVENRCNELVEALDRIVRPVWWMQEDQRRATGSISGIDGAMAITLSQSADYLRGIAERALRSDRDGKPIKAPGVPQG